MRVRTLAAAAFVACAALPARPAAETDWTPHIAGLPFVVGLDRGREEAKFTGMSQMLFFTSATDAGSRSFAARSWKDADVVAKVAGYTPVLLEFETADPAMKTKYKVEFVPSIVWIDHDEKWLYAVYGDAPLDILRKETEIARARCPKPREPAEGWKTLLALRKSLDDAAAAKDAKAQFAAINEIRKIRLGEPVQAAARAAEARLAQEGLDEVERLVAVFDDKKSTSGRRNEAKKALEKLVQDYGAEHAVAKAAQAALDRITGKSKPKK